MAKKVTKAAQPKPPISHASKIVFPPLQARSEHDYKDAHRCEVLVTDQIHLIKTFLTPHNSRSFLQFFQSVIAPLLSQPVPPRRGEAARTNERFAIQDAAFASSLYARTNLDACCAELGLSQSGTRKLVGLNSNVRVYRYREGAFFSPHYDDAVVDPKTGWRSEWTLLVYLTEGGELVGGETAFHLGKDELLAPKVTDGLALLHRHGKDCLLHEGMAVKKGVKWVLRSDLMYA